MIELALPLSIGFADQGHGHGCYGVLDSTGKVIAEDTGHDLAKFIVLACNNHKGLLEACQELPIDKFISEDVEGEFELHVDDAADFKDNSNAFCRAMVKAAKVMGKIVDDICPST